MLALPSGKLVDISVDRAKYHALRQPGFVLTSSHRSLYPLVDIIYRQRDDDGNPMRGWSEFDYVFSTYTLDGVRLANDWSGDDKVALFRWVEQDTQRQRIEMARRRLVDNFQQLSIKTYTAPGHLYSLLHQRIEDLPQKSADISQWIATVSNMQKSGLRNEELKWSRLLRYLKQQASDVVLSKQQVLENINFDNICIALSSEQIWGRNGGLNFNEVALRMPHQVVYRAALKLDQSCHCILRYVDSCYNYRVGVVKTLHSGHKMALNKYWFALDPYGRPILNKNDKKNSLNLFFESSCAAKLAADKQARNHLGMRSGASAHTRYDHLTLYGGQDYREWIVSLPDHQRIFFGGHFYDHNVLVHIRTTARINKQGQSLLFIEEIQSDWHQTGKIHGYDTSYWGQVADAPFKKEWPILAVKLMLIHASQNGFDGIAWTKGDIQEKRYNRDLKGIKYRYDSEIPKSLNRLLKPFQSQVEATFIETRDPWLTLEKTQDKWRVADGQGKFATRAKYKNRSEAMAVITRHCRAIDLEVPVIFINDKLRKQVAIKGLPLFGETIN